MLTCVFMQLFFLILFVSVSWHCHQPCTSVHFTKMIFKISSTATELCIFSLFIHLPIANGHVQDILGGHNRKTFNPANPTVLFSSFQPIPLSSKHPLTLSFHLILSLPDIHISTTHLLCASLVTLLLSMSLVSPNTFLITDPITL